MLTGPLTQGTGTDPFAELGREWSPRPDRPRRNTSPPVAERTCISDKAINVEFITGIKKADD